MHQITKKMNTEQHGLLPGFDTSDGSRQTICSSLQLMTMLFLWWWWFSIGGDFSVVVVVRLDGWLPKTYSMAKSNDPWEDTSEWMMMTIMVYQDADDDDGDGCDNDDGSLMERQKSINCSMRRRSWVITVRNQHGNDDHDQDDRMQLWGWIDMLVMVNLIVVCIVAHGLHNSHIHSHIYLKTIDSINRPSYQQDYSFECTGLESSSHCCLSSV